MQEQSVKSNIPEIRALRILETYEGFNNYILGIIYMISQMSK
jgi:hypothetical protein